MPFHPIALHFHIAMFMVNTAVLIVLAFMRLGTSPNIIDGEKPTRGQSLVSTLDWVCVITLIAGLITTAIGIGTGFYELIHPPEIASFGIDMFMLLKIYISFVFLALYIIPLLARLKIGQKMWKSKGMSITYIILILIGFFLMWVTTFLGSYDTSWIMTSGSSPVEESAIILEWLSQTGIFVIFGAVPGNIVAFYTPGVEVGFLLIPSITTIVITAAITVLSFNIFYGLRTSQIKSFQEKFNQYKSLLMKEKISKGTAEYQQLLKEMIALGVHPPDY